jgi:hypothetical protein
MFLVVEVPVHLLSLLQAVTDFDQEFIPVGELLIHCWDAHCALLVRQYCRGVAAIHDMKWRSLQGDLKSRVVAELNPWQPLHPLSWSIPCQAPQIHGDNLVSCLRLAVGLQMKGGGHVERDLGEFEELPPKVAREHWVAITNN